MRSPDKARKGKNSNDPSRFIQKTTVTDDGEIAQKRLYKLDEERIREDNIKAHFLTCYISLLVYRLPEKKLGEEFTCSEILKTLREMNMTLLSKDSGYIPSCKRTELTDALHTAFGFRTDYEFISKAATPLINTGVMAVFGFIKCQRRDSISILSLCIFPHKKEPSD